MISEGISDFGLKEIIEQLDGPISAEKAAYIRNKLETLRIRSESGKKDSIDFKAIVDSMNEGIYITDKDSVIRYINPAYTKHTLLMPEDVIGKKSQELVDEGIFYKVATPEAIRTKRTQVLLGYIRTVEERDIYGYCIVRPILDKNDEVCYIVLTLYDPERLRGRYAEFAHGNSAELPIRIREGPHEKEGVEPAVGSSEALKTVYSVARRVALTDATILIYGESGVGKEGVADYIYMNSSRRNKPYVKVNCAAIPANLLESELFGYEKGAFTGANSKGKTGLFESADKGTILLDEIGDLSIDLQAKLLRVIQHKEFLRIGGNELIKLDVRIVSSTNADLKKKIEEGKFREDLYYRISTIPIPVPPLRERREDIPDLVNYYLDYFGQHHHRSIQLSDEMMTVLERYEWPGNIRQLRNVIEYLVVCGDDEYLSNVHPLLRMLGVDGYSASSNILPTLDESVCSYEKGLIVQAVNKTGGVRKAAKILGVDPATLSRRIKKYGIRLPKQQ